jgi:phenylacetate-CoA ligase
MTTLDDRTTAVETLDRASIEQLQEDRLLEVVSRAYECSALTRRLWERHGTTPQDITSIATFRERAPMLTKKDVLDFAREQGDPFGGMLCGEVADLDVVGSTSGTTGKPMPVPLNRGGTMQVALARDFRMVGHRPGDYLVFNIPSFRPCHYGDFFQKLRARPILLDHSPAQTQMLIDASLRYRPTVFYMLSTPLVVALEEHQKATGTDMREVFASYRAVMYAGEPLSPRLESLLASWGVTPFIHSGMADIQGTSECPEHDGLHIWEDQALVECIDPDTGAPVADGEVGELVATSLGNNHAPMIRYRSGDAVRLTRRPCACGRTHARMHISGRKSDEVIVSGQSIFPTAVWGTIETIDECSSGLFQVLKTSHNTDVLRVRVGYRVNGSGRSAAEIREHVTAALAAATGLTIDVDLVANNELLRLGPPHKIPRLADR